MQKYTYKTKKIDLVGKGIVSFRKKVPDLDAQINAEAQDGWRLHDIVAVAGSNFGATETVILIFEKPLS